MSWAERAECRTADLNLFYTNTPTSRNAALGVCSQCTVKAECLADALRRPKEEDFGVRGGMTARQRRLLRREQAKMQHTPVPLMWDAASGKYRQVAS